MPDLSEYVGLSTGTGSLRQRLNDALLTGVAVTIPLIVTLLVVGFVVDLLSGTLDPIVGVVNGTLGLEFPGFAVKTASLLTLLASILAVGAVVNRRPGGRSTENSFDRLMMRVPGIGSVYRSFNEMSRLLVDSDVDTFQEVVLVEYPTEGAYTVAFLTADTPERFEAATGHPEMRTVFLPMAPNPVMGGFVLHVSSDRITDVDMTVEEGIESIVTSGVTVGDSDVTGDETEPDAPEQIGRQPRDGPHAGPTGDAPGDANRQ